ncbi:MAG: DNA repair protein RecN [Alphaproteobacteria bacterium]
MLVHLSIRNIVLIDALNLDFSAGLTVLTGETGAGKSILLDSLGLATGARADYGLIRHGQDKAGVTAVFDLPTSHPVHELLSQQDIPFEGELILRRQLTSDGRSKAFINDEPVSARFLSAVGAIVLEVHGQHDERGLLDPKGHMALLDRFGGHVGQLTKLGALYDKMQTAQAALLDFEQKLTDAAEEREYLTHVLEELERLSPQPGEEDELASHRQTMMNAEKVGSDLNDAMDLLTARGDGVDSRLSQAMRLIERASSKTDGAYEALATVFDKALNETADARSQLEAALREIDYDPVQLENVEERLFALRAAARKHKVPADQLPDLITKWRQALTALDEGEGHLLELRQAADQTRAAFNSAADKLTANRQKAAAKLDAAVMSELPPLKLDKAAFMTRVAPLADEQIGRAGKDHIVFEVATNPGSAPGPLIKIASGGELARFILALKVALAGTGSAETLIFDEVDRGIGGATAAAVGARLCKLADGAQVLVVTHSPQVAALGRAHYQISKVQKKNDSLSDVVLLDALRREEEIARMLSGATVTDEARAAAAQLLKG